MATSVRERPLQPMELLVLVALSTRPLHGYGIVRAIEASAGLRVRPGNLYRVIERLVDAEMIAEDDGGDQPSLGAERTRFFRITAAGLERATREVETLGRAVAASPTLVQALQRGLEESP